MAHWQDRPEARWKAFRFNQPYAKGLRRLKDEVLAKTDFDPATLWQWGTMQAMAIIAILKSCERAFGAARAEGDPHVRSVDGIARDLLRHRRMTKRVCLLAASLTIGLCSGCAGRRSHVPPASS